MTTPSERIPGSPTVQLAPAKNTNTSTYGYDLFLSTFDITTGEPLGNVSVYLDGGYAGSTSAAGTIGIQNPGGEGRAGHTVRVSKSGYVDITQSVELPSTVPVKIGLQPQALVPIREAGPHSTKIDIVFVPSSTTYNCAGKEKIMTTLYVTNKNAFVSDVNKIVNESLFTLDSITDKTDPLPADYRDRFNIYYYYDPSRFADGFDGFAGTVPENVWESVPFADVIIILYPTYPTPDIDPSCDPNGAVSTAASRIWMKVPADQPVLFMHESGHALFGLVDTYCGDTAYWQNDPDPNVWSSRASCVKDANNNSWEPSACRQIQQDDPTKCTKQFWRLDPDPDIMHEENTGTFGEASTRRIAYVLNFINAGGQIA